MKAWASPQARGPYVLLDAAYLCLISHSAPNTLSILGTNEILPLWFQSSAWPNGFLISLAHHVLGKTEISWAEKENLALNLGLSLLTLTLTYYLTSLNLIFFHFKLRIVFILLDYCDN